MKNRLLVPGIALALALLGSQFAGADESGAVQPATMEKYQKVRGQIETLVNSPVSKRVPEVVEQVRKSIAEAQEGLKKGDDKTTRESVEKAALQIVLANALAEEREADVTTDAVRKLLTFHENRLATILSGKGDK